MCVLRSGCMRLLFFVLFLFGDFSLRSDSLIWVSFSAYLMYLLLCISESFFARSLFVALFRSVALFLFFTLSLCVPKHLVRGRLLSNCSNIHYLVSRVLFRTEPCPVRCHGYKIYIRICRNEYCLVIVPLFYWSWQHILAIYKNHKLFFECWNRSKAQSNQFSCA